MEPKKKIKKHHLTKPEYTFNNEELMSRIMEAAQLIQRNSLNGLADWVVMGGHPASNLNNIVFGEWRIEDGSYTQDITVTPNRSLEYLDLNITFTGDTWVDL